MGWWLLETFYNEIGWGGGRTGKKEGEKEKDNAETLRTWRFAKKKKEGR